MYQPNTDSWHDWGHIRSSSVWSINIMNVVSTQLGVQILNKVSVQHEQILWAEALGLAQDVPIWVHDMNDATGHQEQWSPRINPSRVN